MSNPYYVFTPAFVPGEKVRAGRVNNQFTLIEDAFDLLPTNGAALPLGTATLGVESGSGNAYVVTMPNTRTANAEGDEVVFKATHQNSGASTLQVDAIPAVGLKRYNGDPLQSGDVLVDSYYVARYDATNTVFKIVSPALQTSVGTLTYATPTGQVKLAASAGSATTVIRSDADIALDQTISPTWSGTHTFSSAVQFASGSAAAPGLAFSADLDTGLFRDADNTLKVTVGGSTAALFSFSAAANSIILQGGTDGATTTFPFTVNDTTNLVTELALRGDGQLELKAGTAAAPIYSFLTDTNTGAYSVGADDWGVATGGTLRFDISTLAITSTLPFLGASGSAAAPQYSFSGDSNTGAYNVGADDWGIATAGTLRFDISTTAVTSTLPWRGPDGTVSAPGLSFSGDTDNGLYRVGANDIGLAVGGSRYMAFNASVGVSALQIVGIPDGSLVGGPGLYFNSDTDNGLYRIGANNWGVAVGGAKMIEFGGSTAVPLLLLAGGTTSASNALIVNDSANSVNQLVVRSDGQIQIRDGSAAVPGYSWVSDTDTGFYRIGANEIGISAGTTAIASLKDGAISFFSSTVGNYLSIGNTSVGFIEIGDNITAPAAPATGRARIYVDGADGDLKIRFGDGTIKTIVVDT